MNNQKINMKIAKLKGIVSSTYKENPMFYSTIPDYCGDWSILMPLVIEHGISFEKVHFGEDTPYFVARDINLMVANKDPQITLALCLLKVLEAKEKANDD